MKKVVIKDLHFAFTKSGVALKNINVDIMDKRMHLFVGPNGAGKSTLLKIISGLYVGYKGTLKNSFNKISFVPERASLPSHRNVKQFLIDLLTISENISKKKAMQILENYYETLEIKKLLNKKCDSLSLGQIKRVLITLALMRKSDIVMLDEPFANLDKKSIAYLYEYIKLRKTNITFVISSHVFDKLENIADDITILVNGESKFSGSIINSSQNKRELERIYNEYVH